MRTLLILSPPGTASARPLAPPWSGKHGFDIRVKMTAVTAMSFLRTFFPSRNQRLIAQYRKVVDRINRLEDDCRALSDEALRGRMDEFRARLGEAESGDDILPEVFAVVREAADRVLGMRHFDVQLIGGMALNNGKIAEMRTGEGKTLVATLPACLNALEGKTVHIVTVNDYLARRDAEWMGRLYEFLGLSVGIVVSGQSGEERQQAYLADVTYGTNNEFGFDYLRDNMVLSAGQRVQRGLNFAIVDEVDSILVDEARTPLIISGPADDASDMYVRIGKLVGGLRPERAEDDGGDYSIDEKAKQVFLTEAGHQAIEKLLEKAGLLKGGKSLYEPMNIELLHYVTASLRAKALFHKDTDYLVRNNEVVIVDEFTGRALPGRRWSDGLHQAIEAKEKVRIQSENQTLASITFQNYFRLYDRLAGMTGTADTEAYEFHEIYGLEVLVVPTHKPMIREDATDLVYVTSEEKFDAIIEDIQTCVDAGQPALVGTASIEVSEYLSGRLKKAGIKHQVLNAKQHEAESHVIANAGRPGTVTIATNMAGRGTDIVLGGSLEREAEETDGEQSRRQLEQEWEKRHAQVIEAGGLHIIGTERHESRRIDNQLRGRSGRQGDPGSSRFYLSLEDNLMRIFAGDKVRAIMEKLGVEKGESIEHPWMSRAIENAQRKVEAHNFDIRKTLLQYDDVANEQRKVIYEQRDELIDSDDVKDSFDTILPEVINNVVEDHLSFDVAEWDAGAVEAVLRNDFALSCPIQQWLDEDDSLTPEAITERLIEQAFRAHRETEERIGSERMRTIEKVILLQVLDYHWKEHLAAMDRLRRGIGLRGFAQKNPRQEYKRESFEMFEFMLERVRYHTLSSLLRIRAGDALPEQEARQKLDKVSYRHEETEDAWRPEAGDDSSTPKPDERGRRRMKSRAGAAALQEARPQVQTVRRRHPKLGRNDPCFCGSGKKYKHCHGAAEKQPEEVNG